MDERHVDDLIMAIMIAQNLAASAVSGTELREDLQADAHAIEEILQKIVTESAQ